MLKLEFDEIRLYKLKFEIEIDGLSMVWKIYKKTSLFVYVSFIFYIQCSNHDFKTRFGASDQTITHKKKQKRFVEKLF